MPISQQNASDRLPAGVRISHAFFALHAEQYGYRRFVIALKKSFALEVCFEISTAGMRSFADILRCGSDKYGDREAIVDGPVRLSYRDLAYQVDLCSKAFLASGVTNGDRIAIWLPNCWQWPIICLGLQSIGAQMIPVNTRYTGHEARYILASSAAKMLFCRSDFLGADYSARLGDASQVRETLPALEQVIDIDEKSASAIPYGSFLRRAGLTSDEMLAAAKARVSPHDIVDIMFTSGTTGNPKGVRTTHAQSLGSLTGFADALGLGEGDRFLVVNPFFHVSGYRCGWLVAFMVGATVIPMAVFDAAAVFAMIHEEKISILPGPPTLFISLLALSRQQNMEPPKLIVAQVGSAGASASLFRQIRERISVEMIVTGYGLTEFTGAATMTHPDDPLEILSNTAGKPLPNVELRIGPVEGGSDEGEILLRGPNVMVDYLDDPKATAEAVDSEGWLHTGDIGKIDASGNLVVTGRLKDLILVGGFNVYPVEVEAALEAHPAVQQAAVIHVPDARMGEVPKAFVILGPGATCSEEELIAFSRGRLANFKVPRLVSFIEALPLTPSGKVQKYLLR